MQEFGEKKSSKMAKMINLSMKLKQKVASCGMAAELAKNRGSLGESASKSSHFTKKCGVFG